VIHVADAVAELIRQQTLRIHPLPGAPEKFYTARAPSLLDQLADAVAQSNGGRGGRTVPGSRIPVSADAIDLWWRIQTSTHGWARNLGVDRHGPFPGLLRRVAAAAADNEPMAHLIRRRAWCGNDVTPDDCTTCWTHRIRGLLTPDLTDRELRGASCWACRTRTEQHDPATGNTTEVWQPTTTTMIEQDGEHYRVPAIVVRVATLHDASPDDLWIYRMCRACGAEGWLDYTTQTAA